MRWIIAAEKPKPSNSSIHNLEGKKVVASFVDTKRMINSIKPRPASIDRQVIHV